jgi:hypothetical protein
MSTVPSASELPQVTKPKLSGFQRRTINNALEGAQEWVAGNKVAIIAQTHALIDRAVGTVHGSADKALVWATEKFAALKF